MEVARSLGLSFTLTALLVAGHVPAAHAVDETAKHRSITVVGVGRERGAPDTAQLRFAVEHTAPSAKAASQAAAKSATQVMEALRKESGSDGRVETAGFQLNPVYRTDDNPGGGRARSPEIVGYTAINEVSVRTRRVDGVGALIDAAIAAGAGRITGLSFTIDDPAPVQARALKGAAADAARQAQAIAEAMQVRVTTVLVAEVEGAGRPIPHTYELARHSAAEWQTPRSSRARSPPRRDCV